MKLENCIVGEHEIVNGVVNVTGDVDISAMELTEIPWRFGTVTGYFVCSDNKWISLKNSPTSVGGGFYCNGNQLKSLQYCPESVDGDFNCGNNQLKSLKYCPTSVGGDFYCGSNQLKSLQYCPESVNGSFYCSDNPIRSFKGIPVEILMKIDNPQQNYPNLVGLIPMQYMEDVKRLIKNMEEKKIVRKITIKDRLNAI